MLAYFYDNHTICTFESLSDRYNLLRSDYFSYVHLLHFHGKHPLPLHIEIDAHIYLFLTDKHPHLKGISLFYNLLKMGLQMFPNLTSCKRGNQNSVRYILILPGNRNYLLPAVHPTVPTIGSYARKLCTLMVPYTLSTFNILPLPLLYMKEAMKRLVPYFIYFGNVNLYLPI